MHVNVETLTLAPSAISATSGLGALFEVATGTGAPRSHGNHLTATIDWGDSSTPTTGHVLPAGWGLEHPGSPAGGTLSFTVVGEHVYAHSGTFKVHVIVASDAGAMAATDGAAIVESFSARGIPKSARIGTALSNEPVAAIALAGGAASPTDFSATIDWGDGSAIDRGKIVAKTSSYRRPAEDFVSPRSHLLIEGTHTFTTTGTFHTKVTITDTKTEEMSTVASDILVSASVHPVDLHPHGETRYPADGPTTRGGSPLPITVGTIPSTTKPTGGRGHHGPMGATVITPIVAPGTVKSSPKKFSKSHTHHPKTLLKIRAAKRTHGPLG